MGESCPHGRRARSATVTISADHCRNETCPHLTSVREGWDTRGWRLARAGAESVLESRRSEAHDVRRVDRASTTLAGCRVRAGHCFARTGAGAVGERALTP